MHWESGIDIKNIDRRRWDRHDHRILICTFAVPCRFQRPSGAIPSSMLGLEAVTGGLEDFGFEDYLNGNNMICLCIVVADCVDSLPSCCLYFLSHPLSFSLMLHADPRESELRPLDMHHGMEVRMGLSKGPVYPSFI